MMLQAVNFYPLLPKRSGFFLTKNFVIFSYTAFFIVLLGIYGIALWNQHKLAHELKLRDADLQVIQEKLSVLTAKYPVSDINILNKSIHDLHTQYENRMSAINLLSPNAHYAAYLSGIAHAIVTDVWLTEISFVREGNTISLKGHALQSSALEQFISQLTQEPVFAGMIFELKELKDTVQAKFPADFFLSSKQVTK
jgi:Tfp pilus assembly protein PilN